MIGRILFFVILALLGYLVYRSFVKPKARDQIKEQRGESVDDMVVCARCGVNIPKRDALAIAGGGYSCREGERCGHAPKA